MDPNGPLARPNGLPLPQGAVPEANPPGHIVAAPPAPGAVQQQPAPPVRRSRIPRGPVVASSSGGISSAPALLELAAAYPMYTEQRRSFNFFVPDAQLLFHALSECDQMANSTDRFLRSAPAWMPIVSQLYISVLWNYTILQVYVTSGYGAHFAEIVQYMSTVLQIQECMVPGPLIPHFQSLAAINGPFDWLGDVTPGLPAFNTLWDAENFMPHADYARQVPVPAIILDQLYHFATWAIPNNEDLYTHFPWYGNVFSLPDAEVEIPHRLGPQLCGSLYTPRNQCDIARGHWNTALTNSFTRVNATAGQPRFTNYHQLFGFTSQTGELQLSWFRQVSVVMQKYTQYVEGSNTLKSALSSGIGASTIYGIPTASTAARNWFYPDPANLTSFHPSRFSPLREIPDGLAISFHHADHDAEKSAEQYAVACHTNIKWPGRLAVQHAHEAVHPENTHIGAYWDLPPHHHSGNVSIKSLYATKIASRYHQQSANRVT